MKIQKGDKVIVLKGKSKGKIGMVLSAIPSIGKVVVEGVNIATVHKKSRTKEKGTIEKIEKPVQVSNVAILDPKQSKPTRVKMKMDGKKKERVCVKSNSVISNK